MMSTERIWMQLFMIVICVIMISQCMNFININATVKSWGDQQLFPPHKIPDNALSPSRSIVRQKIVIYHNFFRTKVKPTSSNMLLMTWHNEAARQAQSYAEKCVYRVHNRGEENVVPELGQCGQNLFVAKEKTPWFFAIKRWFVEYRKFTFGSPHYNLHDVGHYTQMVWATSHKVGCGLAYCPGGPWGHFYNFVCHYCPGGNIDSSIQFPYKPGKPCATCPEHCVSNLCTNTCSKRDLYSNCADLVSYPGICASGHCNATCDCGTTRIHKNYPWN